MDFIVNDQELLDLLMNIGSKIKHNRDIFKEYVGYTNIITLVNEWLEFTNMYHSYFNATDEYRSAHYDDMYNKVPNKLRLKIDFDKYVNDSDYRSKAIDHCRRILAIDSTVHDTIEGHINRFAEHKLTLEDAVKSIVPDKDINAINKHIYKSKLLDTLVDIKTELDELKQYVKSRI